ncbi:uncharacterized protein LOC127858378 [Dreissena polymorpha]|uniref:uncharacterized protein LOC127858378 n=1 Tax=Dreissena polymorpha TaxID=45954 RepID=UPI0022649949|nr:uncharacterized protein LOC127858378 [Dreissena polymorpha]
METSESSGMKGYIEERIKDAVKSNNDALLSSISGMINNITEKALRHRQKLILMADTSELGWRVVNEYATNPIASDSEDEKRIQKAEARAIQITDDVYILDVIRLGYKLPFKVIPEQVFLKNNKSARENPDFVSKEINSLLQKGVISEVCQQPYAVNPLTVAYNRSGKPRLVLDCRHINPCLHLFKIKFDDINIDKSF